MYINPYVVDKMDDDSALLIFNHRLTLPTYSLSAQI